MNVDAPVAIGVTSTCFISAKVRWVRFIEDSELTSGGRGLGIEDEGGRSLESELLERTYNLAQIDTLNIIDGS